MADPFGPLLLSTPASDVSVADWSLWVTHPESTEIRSFSEHVIRVIRIPARHTLLAPNPLERTP